MPIPANYTRDEIELRYDEIMLLDNPATKDAMLSPIVGKIMDAKILTIAMHDATRTQLTAMTHANLCARPATPNELLLTNHYNVAFGAEILALARDPHRLRHDLGIDGLAWKWHLNIDTTEDMFAFLCYSLTFCMLTTKSTKSAQAMDSSDASFFPRGGLCRGEPRNIQQGLSSLGLIVLPGNERENVERVFLNNYYLDMTADQYIERAVMKLKRAMELYKLICSQTLQRSSQPRAQPVWSRARMARARCSSMPARTAGARRRRFRPLLRLFGHGLVAFCENKPEDSSVFSTGAMRWWSRSVCGFLQCVVRGTHIFELIFSTHVVSIFIGDSCNIKQNV